MTPEKGVGKRRKRIVSEQPERPEGGGRGRSEELDRFRVFSEGELYAIKQAEVEAVTIREKKASQKTRVVVAAPQGGPSVGRMRISRKKCGRKRSSLILTGRVPS